MRIAVKEPADFVAYVQLGSMARDHVAVALDYLIARTRLQPAQALFSMYVRVDQQATLASGRKKKGVTRRAT